MLPAATEWSSGFHRWRAAALDERDVGQAALAEPIAETGDELEARGSAADDRDSMLLIVAGRRRHEIRSPLPLRGRAFERREPFRPHTSLASTRNG